MEAAAVLLTSEQLYALAARVAAAELREPQPARRFDLATSVALDLDATIRLLVSFWGPDGIGSDVDIVAAWLYPQLVRAGVPEAAALAALERVTDWRPRSDAERWAQVARDMIEEDGFAPERVTIAISRIRSLEVGNGAA